MAAGSVTPWLSRETRLLLLTVAVCAGALVGLARLRFPGQPPADASAPPLERLAARASYDELAAGIERVEALIAAHLVVLRVGSSPDTAPRSVRDVLAPAERRSSVRHVAALRIRPDAALALLDSGASIDGIVGTTGESAGASLIAVDPVRRIARVRVPDAPVRPLPIVGLEALWVPLYVVVVEGTQAGVTLRPVFLGRGDRFSSMRWSRPLLPLGGSAVAPGSLLFTLTGEFIGLAVVDAGATAVADAGDVSAAADALSDRTVEAPPDPGFSVQRLTPPMMDALGVSRGVVVSEVDPAGSAAGLLDVTDVITALDGRPVDDTDAFLLDLVSRRPGTPATLAVTRRGEPRVVVVPLEPALREPVQEPPMTLSPERGAGTRVEHAPKDSPLMAGDVILRAGAMASPTPAQVRRLLEEPAPGGFLTLVVRREGRQQVVVLNSGARE